MRGRYRAAIPDGRIRQRGILMYTPITQTITRRTIKRVENRLKGLRDVTATIPDWSLGTPLGTIGSSGSSQSLSFATFMDILSGRRGELKIEATQFAEGMVRLMYGLEPNCGMPTPGLPIVAGANPPRFCSTSVAGAIERCRINEASASIAYVDQQLQRRSSDGTQMAPLILNWYNQYGRNDVSYLNGVILTARGACGITGGLPKLCPSPQVWSTTQLKCIYPTE